MLGLPFSPAPIMHNCEDGAVESAVTNAAATTADKKRQDIAPYTHCVGVENGCCLLKRTEINFMLDPMSPKTPLFAKNLFESLVRTNKLIDYRKGHFLSVTHHTVPSQWQLRVMRDDCIFSLLLPFLLLCSFFQTNLPLTIGTSSSPPLPQRTSVRTTPMSRAAGTFCCPCCRHLRKTKRWQPTIPSALQCLPRTLHS